MCCDDTQQHTQFKFIKIMKNALSVRLSTSVARTFFSFYRKSHSALLWCGEFSVSFVITFSMDFVCFCFATFFSLCTNLIKIGILSDWNELIITCGKSAYFFPMQVFWTACLNSSVEILPSCAPYVFNWQKFARGKGKRNRKQRTSEKTYRKLIWIIKSDCH